MHACYSVKKLDVACMSDAECLDNGQCGDNGSGVCKCSANYVGSSEKTKCNSTFQPSLPPTVPLTLPFYSLSLSVSPGPSLFSLLLLKIVLGTQNEKAYNKMCCINFAEYLCLLTHLLTPK